MWQTTTYVVPCVDCLVACPPFTLTKLNVASCEVVQGKYNYYNNGGLWGPIMFGSHFCLQITVCTEKNRLTSPCCSKIEFTESGSKAMQPCFWKRSI